MDVHITASLSPWLTWMLYQSCRACRCENWCSRVFRSCGPRQQHMKYWLSFSGWFQARQKTIFVTKDIKVTAKYCLWAWTHIFKIDTIVKLLDKTARLLWLVVDKTMYCKYKVVLVCYWYEIRFTRYMRDFVSQTWQGDYRRIMLLKHGLLPTQ